MDLLALSYPYKMMIVTADHWTTRYDDLVRNTFSQTLDGRIKSEALISYLEPHFQRLSAESGSVQKGQPEGGEGLKTFFLSHMEQVKEMKILGQNKRIL